MPPQHGTPCKLTKQDQVPGKPGYQDAATAMTGTVVRRATAGAWLGSRCGKVLVALTLVATAGAWPCSGCSKVSVALSLLSFTLRSNQGPGSSDQCTPQGQDQKSPQASVALMQIIWPLLLFLRAHQDVQCCPSQEPQISWRAVRT